MSHSISGESRQAYFFHICRDCGGECCKGARPPITPSRRGVIENYLKAEGIKIEKPCVGKTYNFPREDEDGYCVFFDKEAKRCRIHPVKPETCVAGPITFDINSKTGKIEWFLKMERICPLAGVLYRDKENMLDHLKSAKREVLTLISDLDSEELSAILKIEEPETFKICEDELDSRILVKLKPPR